jgi:hypothetical protein
MFRTQFNDTDVIRKFTEDTEILSFKADRIARFPVRENLCVMTHHTAWFMVQRKRDPLSEMFPSQCLRGNETQSLCVDHRSRGGQCWTQKKESEASEERVHGSKWYYRVPESQTI